VTVRHTRGIAPQSELQKPTPTLGYSPTACAQLVRRLLKREWMCVALQRPSPLLEIGVPRRHRFGAVVRR
jgi:hypothetical protein